MDKTKKLKVPKIEKTKTGIKFIKFKGKKITLNKILKSINKKRKQLKLKPIKSITKTNLKRSLAEYLTKFIEKGRPVKQREGLKITKLKRPRKVRGTFTKAKEAVKKAPQIDRQKIVDTTQNQKIRDLEEKLKKAEEQSKKIEEQSKKQSREQELNKLKMSDLKTIAKGYKIKLSEKNVRKTKKKLISDIVFYEENKDDIQDKDIKEQKEDIKEQKEDIKEQKEDIKEQKEINEEQDEDIDILKDRLNRAMSDINDDLDDKEEELREMEKRLEENDLILDLYKEEPIEEKKKKKKNKKGGMLTDNEDQLTTTDINKIMDRYPNYHGTYPKDHFYKAIYDIKPNSNGGCILNLDTSDKGGSHWVAVYYDGRDNNKNQVCYFDSFGREPPQDILEDLHRIPKKLECSHYCKLKINRNQQQHKDSVSCGYIACEFLMDMFRGKSFKSATNYTVNKREDNAEELQEKFKYML